MLVWRDSFAINSAMNLTSDFCQPVLPMEDDLNGRLNQWKIRHGKSSNPSVDASLIYLKVNLNGRGPPWKRTSSEDNLNGRQPHWKTTSMEANLNVG